jgi:hypothetical protein
VIDVSTGKIIRIYRFAAAPTFINDVVLTRRYAWFTDSQQPQLYGVRIGRGGRPGGKRHVVTLPLSGEWQQGTTASTPTDSADSESEGPARCQLDTGLLYRR